MIISNNTNTSISYESKTEKTTKSNITFEQELKERFSKSRIITYHEEKGRFDEMSEENAKAIKYILEDDKVSMQELTSMPFERIKLLKSIVFPSDLTKDEFADVLITFLENNRATSMLLAVDKTANDNFNEALFNTLGEILDDSERMDFMKELDLNLTQMFNSQDLEFSFMGAKSILIFLEVEKEKTDIDYSNFFDKMISKTKFGLSTPFLNPDIKKNYKVMNNSYTLLKDFYEDIKSTNEITLEDILKKL